MNARSSIVCVAGAAAVASAIAMAVACEAESYVYTARRYNADASCLEPYRAIEVVSGPGISSRCPLLCLTSSGATFVSAVCPPFPSNAAGLPNDDPSCRAAFAVAAVTCGDADASVDSGKDDDDGDARDAGGVEDAANVEDAAESG